MTFYVENETEENLEFDVEELLKSLTDMTLEILDCPFRDVTVNLSLTDDENIREINKEFRDIDKSTDVLSFPALNFSKSGDFSFISDEDPDYFDISTGELILGDICISLEHAHAQAQEYGHSFKREIAFLITHSLLHLSGFDHINDDEREEMESLQKKILEKLGITRENG